MRKQWTKVGFDLPFLIPVNNGSYEVSVRGAKSKISIERIQRTNKIGMFHFEGNADLKFDTHGRLSFSRVSVEIPGRFGMTDRHDRFFDSKRLIAVEKALEHLNRFIEVIRHASQNFSLKRARYPDVLEFSISHLTNGTEEPHSVGISTGTAGLAISSGEIQHLTAQQKEQVIRRLQNEEPVDPSISFLLDAKAALLDEDYASATVLGVIALEISLSRLANDRARRRDVTSEQVEELVKGIGLKNSLDILLKLLLEPSDPTPDDAVLSTCSGAITVRNHVVHRGLRTVSKEETIDRVVAIERMVGYLASLMTVS